MLFLRGQMPATTPANPASKGPCAAPHCFSDLAYPSKPASSAQNYQSREIVALHPPRCTAARDAAIVVQSLSSRKGRTEASPRRQESGAGNFRNVHSELAPKKCFV